MAIKKSELYSSLWKSCDELRGSMDLSQYKDYVLVLLFMKYVTDKGGALVDIPEGGSFKDMIKLKGKDDIGDKINKIIGELAKANDRCHRPFLYGLRSRTIKNPTIQIQNAKKWW